MKQHENDIIRSVIAIVLCIVFLWTGKTFIWNKAQDPDIIPASETEPDISIEPNPFDSIPVDTEPAADLNAANTEMSTEAGFPELTDEMSSMPTETVASASLSNALTSTTSAFTTVTSTTVTSTSAVNNALTSSTTTSSTISQTSTTTTTSTTATSITTTSSAAQAPAAGFGQAPAGYFNDALFIGDSRLVGIGSFAPLDDASYFATVGLSTYKLDSAKSEVKPNKGQTFAQVLSSKKFSKVYIVMGINELGYDLTKTMNNYRDLITKVRSANPGCTVYVNANLHVSAARSAKDKVVNNTKINKFNEGLRALTNGTDILYLDVNPVFDDGKGNFDKQYTNDGTHPTAKNYKLWAEWLRQNVKL